MAVTLVQVDAFSSRPFAGNPAAVCVLPVAREAAWMQAVARELNLSETAFLVPEGEGFHLRWFTPVAEVDLCGHATLAGAHVLWEDGHLKPAATARFTTLSGELTARREQIRAKASGQMVETFVSDGWTLEYDLAHAGLAKDTWVAAHLALADERINAEKTDRKTVETEASAAFVELIADGMPEEWFQAP